MNFTTAWEAYTEPGVRVGAVPEGVQLVLPGQNRPEPVPLYRGLSLDLSHPDLAALRRALHGKGREDIKAPDEGRHYPCTGCPTDNPGYTSGDGPGVQGALPLSRDYSEYNMAFRPKGGLGNADLGERVISHILGGDDDSQWVNHPDAAEDLATGGNGLPVVLSAEGFNEGEPNITGVRIRYPETGKWRDLSWGGRY